MTVLQCEHPAAVENFAQVYGIPGVDAVFVGPNDLAANMRSAAGHPPSPAAFEAALAEVERAAKALKVPVGIHCTSAAEALRYVERGWQFLAIASELKMMLDGAGRIMAELGRGKGEMAKY